MENQLTFDFFKIPNEIKTNKIHTIFRKQFVSVKKNHIKRNDFAVYAAKSFLYYQDC